MLRAFLFATLSTAITANAYAVDIEPFEFVLECSKPERIFLKLTYKPATPKDTLAYQLGKKYETLTKGTARIEKDGEWSDHLLYIEDDYYYILGMDTEWFVNRYTGSVYRKPTDGKKRTEFTCEKREATPKW